MELIVHIITMLLEHMVLHHTCEAIEKFVVQMMKKARSKQRV